MTANTIRLRTRFWTVVLLVLSSCTGRSGLFRSFRKADANKVGVVLPLSGPYQRVGEAVLEGIKTGFQGSKVKLEVRDSKGDPSEAERAVESLASEGAVALLGGVVQAESEAAGRRADALGLPIVTFSKAEGATEVGGYVFRNMVTLKEQAEAVGRFAACELGLKRYAWLGPDADYARELKEGFTKGFGSDPVREERYPAGQTTFTSEARRLTGRDQPEKRPDYQLKEKEILAKEQDPFRRRKALEKLRSSLPPLIDYDGLFIADGWQAVSLIAPALAVEDMVTEVCDKAALDRIRKMLGRDDLKPVTLLGWGGWSSPLSADGTPELMVRSGRHLQCAIYADAFSAGSERKASRRLVAAYRAAHNGETPQLLQAVGYDSAGIYRSIIEKEGTDDPSRFASLLSATQRYEGATGSLWVDGSRNVRRALLMMRVGPEGPVEQPVREACRNKVARR